MSKRLFIVLSVWALPVLSFAQEAPKKAKNVPKAVVKEERRAETKPELIKKEKDPIASKDDKAAQKQILRSGLEFEVNSDVMADGTVSNPQFRTYNFSNHWKDQVFVKLETVEKGLVSSLCIHAPKCQLRRPYVSQDDSPQDFKVVEVQDFIRAFKKSNSLYVRMSDGSAIHGLQGIFGSVLVQPSHWPLSSISIRKLC